jgi:processive 1,2-diacylglycerol beta-glucosyltransferase
VRVLILTADIGEGHDLPARVLRDALLERRPDASVRVADAIEVAGPLARLAVRSGSETILRRAPWLFDVQYWLAGRLRVTRRLAGWVAMRLAARALLRLIADERPDVIVCTYPLANEVLGRLRLQHRVQVPVASAVTDLAALWYWAHPGCELHLVIHPESADEIRAIAGPGARIEAVRGLTAPAFEQPVDQDVARAALGLPAGVPLVAVSGGGWGVGDLRGAVDAALRAGPDVAVVVLCGRNAQALATLAATYALEPRVRVMGFTDRMADVLAAADVLVHSTAGLTVFEALVRGARVISFGWGVGHIRLNNRAYRRFGLADVVPDTAGLTPAVQRALASPRRPDLAYGTLPAAADRVIALAEGGDGARRAEHAATCEHED